MKELTALGLGLLLALFCSSIRPFSIWYFKIFLMQTI